MIALLGKTCSGKNTILERLLREHPNLEKLITYTTRPCRNGEVDGIDYNFISDEEFDNLDFLEIFVAENGWKYGSILKDDNFMELFESRGSLDEYYKNHILIITPSALLNYSRVFKNFLSIYISVDEETIIHRQAVRGDNFVEAIRRRKSDEVDFQNLENIVDVVVDGTQNSENVFREIEDVLMKRDVLAC